MTAWPVSAGALFELAKKANATAPIDCAPAPPTPQVGIYDPSMTCASQILSLHQFRSFLSIPSGPTLCARLSEQLAQHSGRKQ